MPPIFSATAAAIVEGMGHVASIVDAQALDLDVEGTIKAVEREKPDLLVSRMALPSLEHDSKVLAEASKETSSIVWGSVAKVFPEKILTIPGVDAVLTGELEFCLPPYISAISSSTNISSLPGISTLGAKGVVQTPPAPHGRLDDLPLPAHHLLDMSRYKTPGSKFGTDGREPEPFYAVLTSRGCRYNCIYCPYMVIYDHGWEAMSPRRAVDEMEELVEAHGIRNIWLLDEVLTQDYARAEEIFNLIIERDLDINWRCESRIDRLPRKILDLMRRSGCGIIQVGVETGDPEMLDVGKPGSSIALIEKTFRDIKEAGIGARASAMVGLPGESWKSIRMTQELLDRIDPLSVEIGVSTPYPGTTFYEMAREEGLITDEDFSHYTINQPVTSLPGFSSRDMAAARRYLLDRYLVRNRLRRSLQSARRGRLDALAREFFPGNLRDLASRVENFVRVRGQV